ncbi:MAG TPA: hypothetical protein PK715_17255 [Chitinophagales bacterium]|nr:hypothetical protein [Chitinophagales bacterium]
MKTLSISIALWAAFMWVAQAQTTLFNQLYYTDTTSMLSVAGKPIQGGYLIAGGFNAPANYSTFYLRRINNSGVSTALFELDGSYNIGYRTLLFGNSFSKTTDEHYILSGVVGQDPLGYDRDFNVIKIAENGQVIWNKLYEVANELEGNAQLIVLPNGEYLLCGWQYKIFANGSFGPTRFYMAGLNGISRQAPR